MLSVSSSGTLDNAGVLTVLPGANGTEYDATGNLLDVAGVLNNSGTLSLRGGFYHRSNDIGGAVAQVTGTLTNTGLVTVGSGGLNYYGGAGGGGHVRQRRVDQRRAIWCWRVMVKSNTAGPGLAGVLIDSGTLSNTGLITVQGGAYEAYYRRGARRETRRNGRAHQRR